MLARVRTERRRVSLLTALAWVFMLLTTGFCLVMAWIGATVAVGRGANRNDVIESVLQDVGPLVPSAMIGIAAVVIAHLSWWIGRPGPRIVGLMIAATPTAFITGLFAIRLLE